METKTVRTKESMLALMEKLNKENKENQLQKKQAIQLFKNSSKIGNKIFVDIPVELLKVDWDMYQRATQRHVRIIAQNWNDDKCDPLMTNYRNDGYFYIIDGQHRLMAALMRGIESLVCIVFVGLSIKEEADLFTEQNEGTKKLSPYDTYKANLCRGEKTDTMIKNICDKYGVAIKKANTPKVLKCLSVVRRYFRSDNGEEGLNWILDVIKVSGWENFSQGHSYDVVNSLWVIYNNHLHELTSVRKKLIDFFTSSSPEEVISLGNVEYPQYSKYQRLNMILEDVVSNSAKTTTKKNTKAIKVA